MTDTTETTAAPESAAPENNGSTAPTRKASGLSSMLLPELKQVAGGLGIKATGMKKAELVAAIRAAQSTSQSETKSATRGGRQTQGARESRREEPQAREERADDRQDGRQDGRQGGERQPDRRN